MSLRSGFPGLAPALSLGLGLLFGLGGCAHRDLAELSSPHIGCELDEIDVEEARVPFGGGPQHWWLSCREQRHFCTRLRPDGPVICSSVPDQFEAQGASESRKPTAPSPEANDG